MGTIDEEGELVPSERKFAASEEQKTLRVFIICMTIMIGWCAWNIRGCDMARTQQLMEENQVSKSLLQDQVKTGSHQ